MKQNKAYYTSTAKILQKMEFATNPVTRASFREIVGSRIDRHELSRMGKVGK